MKTRKRKKTITVVEHRGGRSPEKPYLTGKPYMAGRHKFKLFDNGKPTGDICVTTGREAQSENERLRKLHGKSTAPCRRWVLDQQDVTLQAGFYSKDGKLLDPPPPGLNARRKGRMPFDLFYEI